MQAFGEYMKDNTASAMKARDHKDATDLIATPIVIDRAAYNQGENAQYEPHIEQTNVMDSLIARGPHAVLYENHPNDSRVTGPHKVAPSCVSRFGTGGGNVPLVQEAIAFEPGIAKREGNDSRFVEEMSPTLRKDMGDNQVAVAVDTYNQAVQDQAIPIRSDKSDVCHVGGVIDQRQRMAVRRLTPKECERLQGFGDDHTLIPWRGKPADQCPDGPRYKALGNSMAVPCMAWIGERIARVVAESTTKETR